MLSFNRENVDIHWSLSLKRYSSFKIFGFTPVLCSRVSQNDLQRRYLSIHEHQAMDLLKTCDILVPDYKIAYSAEEAYDIAKEFG